MDSPKKKILVIHVLAGNVNASSRTLKQCELIKEDDNYEHKVIVFQRNEEVSDEVKNLLGHDTIFSFRRKGTRMSDIKALISFLCFLTKTLASCDRSSTIIHWHERTTSPIMLISHALGVRYLYDTHDITYHELLSFPRKNLLKWAYGKIYLGLDRYLVNRADKVMAVSEGMKNYAESYYPINDVVHFPSFPILPNQSRDSCEKTDYEDGTIKPKAVDLCYWGKISHARLPLASLKYLPENDISLSLIGPIEGADYFEELLALSKEHVESIQLIDKVPANVLINVIPSEAIAFFPFGGANTNLSVTIPNKFWQAVFLRMPIICLGGSEMSRIVSENKLGVVIAIKDFGGESLLAAAREIKLNIESYRSNMMNYKSRYLNEIRASESLKGLYQEMLRDN